MRTFPCMPWMTAEKWTVFTCIRGRITVAETGPRVSGSTGNRGGECRAGAENLIPGLGSADCLLLVTKVEKSFESSDAVWKNQQISCRRQLCPRRQAAVLPRDAGKVVGCMVKKMFSGCPYAYL